MKNKLFKLLLHVILWAIMIYLLIVLEEEFLRNAVSNTILIVLVVLYMFPKVDKSIEKEFKKESSEKAKDLYSWTVNLDGGDNYLEYIFKSLESNSVPSNLIVLYNQLIIETENNPKKLRLLRAYYKAYKDKQASKLYFKFVGTALFSFIVFSLQGFLQGRITNDGFLSFIQPSNSWGLIISLILIAIYFILLPHRKENRINLIINVLDEIIEIEESNERKTNLQD